MSRKIYVDELESMWHRTVYIVDDSWTDDRIEEFMKDNPAYKFEDETGVEYLEGEYLFDTSETVDDTLSVLDQYQNEIYSC